MTSITTEPTTDFTAEEVLIGLARAVGSEFLSGEDIDQVVNDIKVYGTTASLSDIDFEWGYYHGPYDREAKRYAPLEIELRGQKYEVKEVDSTGGEDEGSRASSTIQVGSQFFRKSGYYASHYGYDWDGDFSEVKAKLKTVVVYE